ncbi:MAG: alpha/beta hydrolase [Candidatus Fimivicinus sp.]|nr:alpha/beta hydrolase [Oscillospiraceae bacterium]MDY5591398.1 alpha/beta hydrolase [Candidatus Fimivicinus sp.]
MEIEEYGKENDSIIVMLHGANFVHSFGRQYPLAQRYHIIVPHIIGFGDEADRTFDADICVCELADYIKGLSKKVLLIGFSLGAQLAFKLISEYPDLFYSAIIVSPWLLNKTEPLLSETMRINEKQLASLKKKWLCNLIGTMNGLPAPQRKIFVKQMQKVKRETIRNVVNNGITIESVPKFAKVPFPIVALAGGKEQKEVTDSVKRMSEINSHCRYEIWERAAHNIPPVFAKRFNTLISDMVQ